MSDFDLQRYIRDIPDFPKPGIIFKDITPLLKDDKALKVAIEGLAKVGRDLKVDYVVGVESRGFIFGAAVAEKLGVGFIPVRKPGKLPYKTRSITYSLEYGTDTLEIHDDALEVGKRVLIVDDLLATGGTVAAVADLLKQFDVEVVGAVFVVELGFLAGREKLGELPVTALLTYS